MERKDELIVLRDCLKKTANFLDFMSCKSYQGGKSRGTTKRNFLLIISPRETVFTRCKLSNFLWDINTLAIFLSGKEFQERKSQIYTYMVYGIRYT